MPQLDASFLALVVAQAAHSWAGGGMFAVHLVELTCVDSPLRMSMGRCLLGLPSQP
jgi:hypothetical protein